MTSHTIEGARAFAWRTHKMMINVPLFVGPSRALAVSVTSTHCKRAAASSSGRVERDEKARLAAPEAVARRNVGH